MEKPLNDLKEYLKENLTRPAEHHIVMAMIEKLLKENVKTKIISTTPEVYYCPSCGKWITEDQIKTVQTYPQTLESPAEYEDYCECGATAEDFDEFSADAENLCELLNEIKYKL